MRMHRAALGVLGQSYTCGPCQFALPGVAPSTIGGVAIPYCPVSGYVPCADEIAGPSTPGYEASSPGAFYASPPPAPALTPLQAQTLAITGGYLAPQTPAQAAAIQVASTSPTPANPAASTVTPSASGTPGSGVTTVTPSASGTPGSGVTQQPTASTSGSTSTACFQLFGSTEPCWGPVGQYTALLGIAAVVGLYLMMRK